MRMPLSFIEFKKIYSVRHHGVILAIIVLIIMFFRYLLRRGVDKLDDSIRHAIDRKTGKMNESESSNLSDRFN